MPSGNSSIGRPASIRRAIAALAAGIVRRLWRSTKTVSCSRAKWETTGGDKTRPFGRRDALRENTQGQQGGERPAERDREPQPQRPTPAQREPLQGSEGQKQDQGKNDQYGAEISHVSPRVSIAIRALLKRLGCSLMTAPSLFLPVELPFRHQTFASGF